MNVVATGEKAKESVGFKWFEIAASAFGQLAMTTAEISPCQAEF